MATAQKKKAAEPNEAPKEAPVEEPATIHSVKPAEREDHKTYVEIDSEDYDEFLWWRASDLVIRAHRDKEEDEDTIPWQEYWGRLSEAERSVFGEVLFRFSEDVLRLYIEKSGDEKSRFLRNYAGLLLVDFYETRNTGS